jgi:hypothetical protein
MVEKLRKKESVRIRMESRIVLNEKKLLVLRTAKE